jgi:hypothetical protein
MLTVLMLFSMAVSGTELPEPVYVLEFPGLGFEFLPQEMSPPVEGSLTEEAGVITSVPGPAGIEYQLHYWKEDLEENTRKDHWLQERFNDTISPDLLPSLLVGSVEWTEGSTDASRRGTSSIGLVPVLNFNSIDSTGNMLGRGRACAVFTDGYSILFYGIAPTGSDVDMIQEMNRIISYMYVAED